MSWFYTDDPVRDAERYTEAQEERLERYPKCDHCGERITDDRLFNIDGKLYHIDCAEDLFKEWTEDHIE